MLTPFCPNCRTPAKLIVAPKVASTDLVRVYCEQCHVFFEIPELRFQEV